MDNKKIITKVSSIVGSGVGSVFVTGVLRTWGVLDGAIHLFGSYLRVHVSPEMAGRAALGLILGLIWVGSYIVLIWVVRMTNKKPEVIDLSTGRVDVTSLLPQHGMLIEGGGGYEINNPSLYGTEAGLKMVGVQGATINGATTRLSDIADIIRATNEARKHSHSLTPPVVRRDRVGHEDELNK